MPCCFLQNVVAVGYKRLIAVGIKFEILIYLVLMYRFSIYRERSADTFALI